MAQRGATCATPHTNLRGASQARIHPQPRLLRARRIWWDPVGSVHGGLGGGGGTFCGIWGDLSVGGDSAVRPARFAPVTNEQLGSKSKGSHSVPLCSITFDGLVGEEAARFRRTDGFGGNSNGGSGMDAAGSSQSNKVEHSRACGQTATGSAGAGTLSRDGFRA